MRQTFSHCSSMFPRALVALSDFAESPTLMNGFVEQCRPVLYRTISIDASSSVYSVNDLKHNSNAAAGYIGF